MSVMRLVVSSLLLTSLFLNLFKNSEGHLQSCDGLLSGLPSLRGIKWKTHPHTLLSHRRPQNTYVMSILAFHIVEFFYFPHCGPFQTGLTGGGLDRKNTVLYSTIL